jgi:hypothetical protein
MLKWSKVGREFEYLTKMSTGDKSEMEWEILTFWTMIYLHGAQSFLRSW